MNFSSAFLVSVQEMFHHVYVLLSRAAPFWWIGACDHPANADSMPVLPSGRREILEICSRKSVGTGHAVDTR